MAGKSKFWLVWSPFNLRLPVRTHDDEPTAVREAKRLSEQNPGLEFFVLRSTHYVYTKDKVNKAQTI